MFWGQNGQIVYCKIDDDIIGAYRNLQQSLVKLFTAHFDSKNLFCFQEPNIYRVRILVFFPPIASFFFSWASWAWRFAFPINKSTYLIVYCRFHTKFWVYRLYAIQFQKIEKHFSNIFSQLGRTWFWFVCHNVLQAAIKYVITGTVRPEIWIKAFQLQNF